MIISVAIYGAVNQIFKSNELYGYTLTSAVLAFLSIAAILIALKTKKLASFFKILIYSIFGLQLFELSTHTLFKQPLAELSKLIPSSLFCISIFIIFIGLILVSLLKKLKNPNSGNVFSRKFMLIMTAPLLALILFLLILAYTPITLGMRGGHFVLLMCLTAMIQLSLLISVIINSLDEMWKNTLNKSMTFAGLATGMSCLSLTLAHHLDLFIFQPEWAFYMVCAYFSAAFIYFKTKH